jgi:transposase
MSRIRRRFDDDFKKNAVKLSHASSRGVAGVAEDLGGNPSLIYRWRKTFTEHGDKTKVAEQEDVIKKMKLELTELKMENEMLKKAAAYFARNVK